MVASLDNSLRLMGTDYVDVFQLHGILPGEEYQYSLQTLGPALLEQKAKGMMKKCVAFKVDAKAAPPRPHYPIWSNGANATKIGEVVSGTQSPSLGVGIGMGYVPVSYAKPGTPIEIEIRGKRVPAVIVPKPIYKKT